MPVHRYDATPLGRATRTPQGFLRADARVTRTGVLTYRRADGSVVRELRRPEQVFEARSLATLADAPLTDLHPRTMVSPANVRELAVGHLSGTARRDDRFVAAELVITDQKMIDAVQRGDRRELSCGYTCDLVDKPGVWNGEHYDAEQTNIAYNHVGLGPRKWGRAGADVALRLDGAEDDFALADAAAFACDDERNDDHDALDPPSRRTKDRPTMDTTTIRIDGLEAQLAPRDAQVVQRAIETRDTTIKEEKARADGLQARLDAAATELTDVKKKLAEASDPKRFDAALGARLELVERARKLLPDDAKLDGLTTRAVHELAIKAAHPDTKLDDKSDDYVAARFDAELEQLEARDTDGPKPTPPPRSTGASVRAAARGAKPPPARKDSAGDDATALKPEPSAWTQPLAASRSRS